MQGHPTWLPGLGGLQPLSTQPYLAAQSVSLASPDISNPESATGLPHHHPAAHTLKAYFLAFCVQSLSILQVLYSYSQGCADSEDSLEVI